MHVKLVQYGGCYFLAAYFIAERRGFAAGCELDDWLQAEAEVERRLDASSGPAGTN